MFKYTQKIVQYFIYFLFILGFSIANWYWPIYLWLGDTPLYRFIWLGIFFILLDLALEIITRSFEQMRLMMEALGFSNEIKKISGGFRVISKFVLPNNLRADHIVVGSSGIWLINVKDDGGKIIFNGEEIYQDDKILNGLMTKTLEMAYALTSYLKQKLNKDLKVAPVVAFSSPRADLSEMPKQVRGVFVSSRKDAVSLVENTDFQLIDQKTIEEASDLLAKK